MTKEEASAILTVLYGNCRENTETYAQMREAIDMAISALQWQDKMIKDIENFILYGEEKTETKKHQKEVGAVADGIVGYETIKKSAEQVTSKLKKPCDSLLTEDSADSKEQKSKLNLISRADAITFVGEAIADGASWYDALNKVPSVSAERSVGRVVEKHQTYDGEEYITVDEKEYLPIVRCKDCEYCKDYGRHRALDCTCESIDIDIHPMDFCSRAKMKGGTE